ncbi:MULTISPECIES: hypothetical protein [unclassified Sulfuricurvum]|uniref:hypothetical protein n=1 Tax=unclassified Sulfuricurvum TaxID=2632390 RepID=UPI0002999D15|nr:MULTISPECIES: hypothetical protein [unclassified Sulfuricurvum]AFV96940.1 hypothetical protein B649_03130 [Candidatus Sulfuricurvum sp. RIFRC-1]OHD90140.1 MAG: hypothetical protein A3G19_09470 [Sulfuricurvum sp. RIFCSPLOWO2_12_FULL_43_24]HBM35075.1 hypothetical protein [Sulfuricurvum sp.]
MDKLISKGLYSELLNRLTTSKVLIISTLAGYTEIKYLKNGTTQYLTLTTCSYPNSDLTIRECSFRFADVELPQTIFDAQDLIYDSTETIYTKEPHALLDEIAYIHDTSYNLLYHYEPDAQCQEITISAHTKDGKLKNYRLSFEPDSDGVRVGLSITSNELSGVFISKSLDKENLVLSSSFDDKYIYTTKETDTIRENGEISRLHSPNWVEVYHAKKDEPIAFRENEECFFISGVGFWSGGFTILTREHFNLMDKEDKERFFAYGDELVSHLNTLFINKKFDHSKRYEFTDDEDCQKLVDSFTERGYEVEKIYTEYSGNGWPPPLFIHKASKGDEEIKIVTHNDWGMEEYVVDVEYGMCAMK